MKNTFKDIYNAVNPGDPITDWSATQRAKITQYANSDSATANGLLEAMKLWPDEWTDEEKAKIRQTLALPR